MSNNPSSDTQIVITRMFKAPRELVFKAFTEAKHIEKWWGPRPFSTRVEEQDFRVGGASRYVMIGPDGTEYPVKGVFIEIDPPNYYVTTDEFDEAHPGEITGMVLRVEFEDLGEETKMTMTMRHQTPEDKKAHEDMGVVGGWNSSFGCLDDYLEIKTSFNLTTPSDREIRFTRLFDAPKEHVFDAFTKSDIVSKWMHGPEGWTMPVCEIDLRVGGTFRYVWRNGDGMDMGMSGTYKEIERPDRIVHAEIFDDNWTGGETIVTTTFDDCDGRTQVTSTVLYSSSAARDAALATPMEQGVLEGYDRLDLVL